MPSSRADGDKVVEPKVSTRHRALNVHTLAESFSFEGPQGLTTLGSASYTGSPESFPKTSIKIIRDSPGWLQVIRNLDSKDVLVLITPIAIPVQCDPLDTSDSFECFGHALEHYHSRIRHIPYTNTNGITSTHVGFMKRAAFIIFVLDTCSACTYDSHTEAAKIILARAHQTPVLIVLKCPLQDLSSIDAGFPTIVHSTSLSESALKRIASLIFGFEDCSSSTPLDIHPPSPKSPRLWQVEAWNERTDIASVCELWNLSVNGRFAMSEHLMASILDCPGYSRHYVVKDMRGQQILGFCATYLSYADRAGTKLTGSIAILFVRPDVQGQGIGLSLHNHAIQQLKRTHGLIRLRLGTTFPRILLGPPVDMAFNKIWFAHRGWLTIEQERENRRTTFDLLSDVSSIVELQHTPTQSSMKFRRCTQDDMSQVWNVIQGNIAGDDYMGWFDQYSRLVGDHHIKDVIVGFEDNDMVAAAITHTPLGGSPIASDMPWTSQIGLDVGGISSENKDSVLEALVRACVQKLQKEGMKKVLMDGVTDHLEVFRKLGRRAVLHERMAAKSLVQVSLNGRNIMRSGVQSKSASDHSDLQTA
ncbi:MAG: hypothetical protein M1818_002620 [Claussenomyces sp. TS43310]|nr:MAG: hypothetical protein M1818_002620 [Claussenomyces sp. TS43310]